ncbi:metallophosphoesterase [Alsobacter soli]|uniref:metallophosphoesterase n=1 Tax=Alsobacter soli TaxID=2109933 RepID=UPI00315A933A
MARPGKGRGPHARRRPRYAIGDIHGRADLLSAQLARIDADLLMRPVRQHFVVALGDYIDRGPQSVQTP